MNYHIILTRRCNLNCEYCHGGEEKGPQTEIQYSLTDLINFLNHDENPQLMFYGGEPTLQLSRMLQIMGVFPTARFMLQTNGLRLHQIPEDYVSRFHSILVSIDGPKVITDRYRSIGVYDKVIENVRWLRDTGFRGDLVARMTVSQQSDIHRDVRHLLNLIDPYFDHVHWQLNVIWAAEGNWLDFDHWAKSSYYPGITTLIEEWVTKMGSGIVEGIVPFLPVMYSLLTKTNAKLRCGSGLDTFAIHVDGSIGICPIAPDWKFSIVGDIKTTKPSQLRDIMRVEEPCPSCGEFEICGGRCLFANKQRLWGEDGFRKVCDTVLHLISELKRVVPRIRALLEQQDISLDVFNYPKYNNGCEIIP